MLTLVKLSENPLPGVKSIISGSPPLIWYNSPDPLNPIDAVVPPTWSRANPVKSKEISVSEETPKKPGVENSFSFADLDRQSWNSVFNSLNLSNP